MTLKISVTLRIRTLSRIKNGGMLRTFQDRTNSCLKHGIDRTWAALWKTNAAHASQATVYSLAGRWTWLCTAPMCRRRFRSILLFLSYNLPLILSLVFTKLLTYSLDLLDFFCFLIYHATLSLWIFLTVIFFVCKFCKFRSRFCYTLRKPKVVSCHSYKFKVWKRPRVQNVFITWIS